MAKILVAGGAGYIGSHAVLDLADNGYECVVLDNFSEGHREAILAGSLEEVDLADKNAIDAVFRKHKIDAVVHFAAYTYVGESVTDPKKYYQNNVVNTLNLLSSMEEHGVNNIVFSSTCAVYGNPQYLPLDEKHPLKPINPYGRTKFAIEMMLNDFARAYGMNSVSLRYFNAAGAHPVAKIGESHRIETHLIPLVLKTLPANGLTSERENIKIFGTDYETPDGTCIRDYIHVCDLANAHTAAIRLLESAPGCYKINLGTGKGSSVREIINAAEAVTGLKVPVVEDERREGDPPVLVANNTTAKALLDWEPEYTDIGAIIETAWKWEKNKRF